MSLPTKILIVDDDPGVLFSLKAVLARDGHQVMAVESGEAALETIAGQEFDLALVDLKMKGIGGMEVLAALRQQWPDTVAIVLTAHASLETAVDALRRGAHDYLFKPCKVVEIRESVRTGLLKRERALAQRDLAPLGPEWIGAEQGEQPRPAAPKPAEEQGRFLERGGLIVDLMRHLVTLDGHLLELSPTEFDLVAYLSNEVPRVVPAQELVREVQGYAMEPWEARAAIRFHIHRIRQKAKAAGGQKEVIRTVRGVGYTLAE